MKRCTELRVAIHDQVSLAVKKTIFAVGQFTSRLFHPGLVGTGRTAGEVNASRFQLDDKQQIKRDEASFGPDFDSSEVDRGEYVPVRFEERAP